MSQGAFFCHLFKFPSLMGRIYLFHELWLLEIVLYSGKYYSLFLIHEAVYLVVLQNRSRATLDLCTAFASHLMVNYMLQALKMELYVCGRRLLVRHMVCGSV